MIDFNMSLILLIMIWIFKEEFFFEVWKQIWSGKFKFLEDFEICKWFGKLGLKFKEGDWQVLEGFYEIILVLMNLNFSYYLVFNFGYFNWYDQFYGWIGFYLMVYGVCFLCGCYVMMDEQVQDIYVFVCDSFKGGQRLFQVQVYLFCMMLENMVWYRDSEYLEFWKMLKIGYDYFEVINILLKILVCEKKYVFDVMIFVDGVLFCVSVQCLDYEVNLCIVMVVVVKQNWDMEKFDQIVVWYEVCEDCE